MAKVQRERLTRKAVDKSEGLFPGDVGSDEREYKEYEQYHTFEQTVNHELPDMRTEWKDNPRDDIGFGIPKKAALYKIAQQATRLSFCLLGDKVSEKTIEKQARDFMRLGSRRIELALKRYADTEDLYTAEDAVTEQNAGNEPPVVQDAPAANDVKPASDEQEVANPDGAIQETTPEQESLQKVAEETEETQDTETEEVVEENSDDSDVSDETQTTADDSQEEILEDAPAVDIEDSNLEEACNMAEDTLDMELQDTMQDEDVTPDEELVGLFADDSADDNSTEVVANIQKKQGIKTLGGQPKVASNVNADTLSDIWKSAPDVSDVFGN